LVKGSVVGNPVAKVGVEGVLSGCLLLFLWFEGEVTQQVVLVEPPAVRFSGWLFQVANTCFVGLSPIPTCTFTCTLARKKVLASKPDKSHK